MESGWTPIDKGLYCEECSAKYKPKLEPGYYWVKITLDGKEQQYIGHNWGDGDWDVFGMDYKYGPDDFSEIGPRITPPAN